MELNAGFRHAVLLALALAGVSGCSGVPEFGADLIRKYRHTPTVCKPVRDRDLVYAVRKGDTLSEIAACFKTQWYHIARRNKLKNPNQIEVGQKLVIPKRGTYRQTASHSKPKASKRQSAAKASRSTPRTKKVASGITWNWPVRGKVVRNFSPKASGKQGIVIAGKMGQSVVAAASGRVAYSGEGLIGYGRLIIVQHRNNFLTAYGHNDRLLVKEGQAVRAGQPIARMGRTAAKTPQLFFEMRYNGDPVNPMQYLPRPGG